MTIARRVLSVTSVAVSLACCGGPTSPAAGPALPDTAKAFGGIQCEAARPQTEPDLMAWDPGSRLNLKLLSNQGVVAVRYEARGCDVRLELLSNCIGAGEYQYEPYAATQSKLARDAQELFAELPLGAASLSGKLMSGRALRTDYMLVGARALKAGTVYSRAQLRGTDCARATHVVNRLFVGGFAMMAGDVRSLEAATTIFGAGGGTRRIASGEVISNEGVADACVEAQRSGRENAQCGVPLRLGLLALHGNEAAPPVVPEASIKRNPPPAPGSFCPDHMVLIGQGTPTIGSLDGADNEKPVHSVQVGAFCMDVTEVTTRAYETCVVAGACSKALETDYCNAGRADAKDHPINCVTWAQADAYCAWAGKRLPTEGEWEYAARGTDGRTFPWGNEPPEGRACWNHPTGTCPVGSFPEAKSPFGLLDMGGNVWEWTSTVYVGDYAARGTGTQRVHRGGAWDGKTAGEVRAAIRNGYPPTGYTLTLGFRCAS